ncbi:UNVERIFIED_ORG: hypothetical protein FHU00_5034 [Citrobacter freundii]
MLSFPASSCRAGRLAGAAGMLFLFTLAIPVQATEQDEHGHCHAPARPGAGGAG